MLFAPAPQRQEMKDGLSEEQLITHDNRRRIASTR
jgi:hypothetical protein